MRKLGKSHDESIDDNKNTWCFEVGTGYEQYSIEAAQKFIKYIGKEPVVDLGAGDGAGTKEFVKNGNKVTAVDINPLKLEKIKDAEIVEQDFLTFLSRPVGHIFMHHSLEHYTDPETVLERIAEHLKPGSYCYIAVPKNDQPHSVHHVAFDGTYELIPEGLEVVDQWETDDTNWPEYGVIVKK